VDKKHNSNSDKKEDEISLDFTKLSKHLKTYSFILLLLILIFVSIYIRTMPDRMPIADRWARDSVYNNIKNNIANSLSQQYPNLPPQSAQKMIDQQFNLILSQQGPQIEDAIKQQSAYLKENFKDETGVTYLGDIDSYYWMRYAKNLLEKGTYGDEIKDGKQYDNHMFAPLGYEAETNLYPYIEAFLLKFLKLFNPKTSLMQAAFYTPLFLSFFAIIAAFLIGKKLSGDFAGFIAAMLVTVNPTVLSRSLGSDNDVVNMVFPLIIMLFTIYAFDAKKYKDTAIFSAFMGIIVGIYSFAWSGWWFIFFFILVAGFSYFGYLVLSEIKKEKKIGIKILNNTFKTFSFKQNIVFLAVFLVFTFISLLMIGHPEKFVNAFYSPIKITSLQEAARGASIWPNVYTTVAELNQADLGGIIQSAGVFSISAGKSGTTVPLLVFAFLGALLPLILFKTGSERMHTMRKGVLALSFFYYLFLILFALGSLSIASLFVLWLIIIIISYILMKNTTGERTENVLLIFSGILTLFMLLFTLSTGSILLFMISMAMPFALSTLFSVYYDYHVDIKHGLILLLWLLATIYAATKGVRFILLITPAFVISFSFFVDITCKWLSSFINKSLGIHKTIASGFVILTVLFLIFLSTAATSTNIGYSAGYSTAYNYIPSVNDGWVSSLTKIKTESKPDAIINSWWDFGHWFKFWADRAVTFDGASQNEAQAHWIGKVLLTNDEKQAVSILRMLDCSGNNAFIALNAELKDTKRSIDEIYRLFSIGKKNGEEEISKITNDKTAKDVSTSMFCEPPEDYFITSEDMVGKSGVWAHFGIWNFERAEIYNYFKGYELSGFVGHMQEQYNYTKDDAQKVYFELNSKKTDREINDWIATWPSYGGIGGCSEANGDLLCNVQVGNNQAIPLRINMTNKEAYVMSQQGEIYYPNAFSYVENGEFKVKRYNDKEIGYAAALLPDGKTILLMSEELADSMFTRLFYFDGIGMKNFKKFYDTRDITGARIITWKIEWPNE